MTFLKNPRDLYARRARMYEFVMNLVRYNHSLESIIQTIHLSELPKNPWILDLGCGTGLVTEFLLQRFPNAKVTGFDFSNEMLSIYKTRFPNAQIVQGDYHNESTWTLPLSGYDLIISSGSLSEYSTLSKTLPWAFRSLKPKGILMNLGVRNNILGWMSLNIWHYQQVLGGKKFSELCVQCGFSKVERSNLSWKYFPLNFFRYIVRAQK